MEYYVERKNDESMESELISDLVADADGMYIKDVSKQKFYLHKIEALMFTAVVEVDSEIEQLKVYKPFGGNAQAHYIKIKIDSTDSAELVISREKSAGIRSGKEPGYYYILQTKNGKILLSNTTL